MDEEEFEDIITKLEEAKSFTPSTVLTDVNLVMECGKVYGIVGKNGAGKTTLMHRIAGFFRGYDGRIGLMGEKDTREWKPTLFAEQVSFLAQVPFMMSWWATLRQNLFLWVPEHEQNEAEAWSYLEEFGLAHKIKKHSRWLESEIGNELELSWWEKQIIAFIRLLLQDRPIIIMDEGTNQLDAENEQRVMSALFRYKRDKIIIFITHRMSTIARADEIFCLEQGTILHRGTSAELLAHGDKVYARFYEAQIGDLHRWDQKVWY